MKSSKLSSALFLALLLFAPFAAVAQDDDDDSPPPPDPMAIMFGAMGQAVQQGAAARAQRAQLEEQRAERQRQQQNLEYERMLQQQQQQAEQQANYQRQLEQQQALQAQQQAQQQAEANARLQQTQAVAAAARSSASTASRSSNRAASQQQSRNSTVITGTAGPAARAAAHFTHDDFTKCPDSGDQAGCTYNVAVTNEGESAISCTVDVSLDKSDFNGGTIQTSARDIGNVPPQATSTVSSNFATGGRYTVVCE